MQALQQGTTVGLAALVATGLLGTDDAAARTRDTLIQHARSRGDVYEALLNYHRDTQGPRIGANDLAALYDQAQALWAWLHNPACLGCGEIVADPADARYVREVRHWRKYGRVIHDTPACRATARATASIRSWGGCPAWMRHDDTAFLAAIRESDRSAIDDATEEND